GVFIELFPLVAECYPHESFRSLNARIRDEALLHLQHSKTGASLPEFSRNCNVVLNYITASFGDFAGFEVETEWIHCGHGDAGHHLRLQVQDFDEKGEFVLQFDFNEAVFPGDRQEFAVSHFFALFDAFVQDPGQSIGAVHLPGKAERQFLLKDFNRSAFTLPAIPSVVDLIEQRARINPGAVAVSDRERALTYQQLNRHADAVAGRLREMGLGTGSVIALLLPRSVETVIGIVGILKAGAAYLPIDPRFPDERVRFMLEDSGARAVVAEAVQPGFEQPVFTIAHMLAGDRTNRGHPPASRDPAYVIYTSGSTGKPKGVVIEHRSLLNYALWAQSTYCGGHPSSFAFFTPLTFDLTVTSLFVPLVSGGEIVVYPESGTGGDFALLDVLEDNRVDLVKLTPSHLSMLRGRDLSRSRVKGLILGGEDLKRDLAAATLQAFRGGVTIYNEYGPTEATVGCMIHAFDPERDL
ncbi:MAG: AMP-binding protein, partial [Akkermansiaceae bacterium]|nr:AMP-binding protein [Akkermansiaceae bacterium]